MSLRIQIVIAVAAVIGILAICNMIRKNKLDLRYALIWIVVGLCVIVLDVFPGLLGGITECLGIELPINMLFFLGFCFSILIIFGLTKAVSDLSYKVKRLTQELALLKNELERTEK